MVCKTVSKCNTTIYHHQFSRFATRIPAFSIGFSTFLFLHPSLPNSLISICGLRFDRQAFALYSWAVIHQVMEVQLGLMFSPTFLDVFPPKTPLIGGDWNMAFMTFHIWGIIIPTDELIFFRGVETTNTNQTSICGEIPHQPCHAMSDCRACKWTAVCHCTRTISSKKSPQKMRSCQTTSMFWD